MVALAVAEPRLTTWPRTLPPGPAQASRGAVATAITLDTVGLVFVLMGAIVAPLQGVLGITVGFVLALIAYVVVQLSVSLSYGRTLGLWALHLRRVTRSDDAPTGLARLFAPCWVADLSRGRDPVLPEPLAVAMPRANYSMPRASGLTPPQQRQAPPLTPVPAAPSAPPPPPAPSHQRGVPTHARVVSPPQTVLTPTPEVDERELSFVARNSSSGEREIPEQEDFEPYNTGTLARSVLIVDGQVAASFDSRAVLGRQPVADDGEQAVAVMDMEREISKTHLAIERDATGRVWVADLNSTNGTVVREPDGTEYELSAGEVREVPRGGIILFGSHTLTVQLRLARYENETRMIEKAPA